MIGHLDQPKPTKIDLNTKPVGTLYCETEISVVIDLEGIYMEDLCKSSLTLGMLFLILIFFQVRF